MLIFYALLEMVAASGKPYAIYTFSNCLLRWNAADCGVYTTGSTSFLRLFKNN